MNSNLSDSNDFKFSLMFCQKPSAPAFIDNVSPNWSVPPLFWRCSSAKMSIVAGIEFLNVSNYPSIQPELLYSKWIYFAAISIVANSGRLDWFVSSLTMTMHCIESRARASSEVAYIFHTLHSQLEISKQNKCNKWLETKKNQLHEKIYSKHLTLKLKRSALAANLLQFKFNEANFSGFCTKDFEFWMHFLTNCVLEVENLPKWRLS